MGTKGKKFRHLKKYDRLIIERLIRLKTPVQQIANILGCSISTIYSELKRGEYEHLNGQTWIYEKRYSPDIAEKNYQENLRSKGECIKLGHDFALAEYIEKTIIEEGLSPAAVLGRIKEQGLKFDVSICVNTLYSYIHNGYFLDLSDKHLVFCKDKKKKKTEKKTAAKAPRGTSIENRPEEINDRNTFGHWEMDCVCGKGKATLLVLTERLTRKEIIMPMRDQTAASVVRCLNSLEKKHGKNFKKIFKSITVDNGSEFSDCAGMERSIYGKDNKRTVFYYCHPYCASERGTNERINREIRRKIPKGSNLADYSKEYIQLVENWVNDYPRRIFGWRTSAQLFREELAKLELSG